MTNKKKPAPKKTQATKRPPPVTRAKKEKEPTHAEVMARLAKADHSVKVEVNGTVHTGQFNPTKGMVCVVTTEETKLVQNNPPSPGTPITKPETAAVPVTAGRDEEE